jgi:hypothetical protein
MCRRWYTPPTQPFPLGATGRKADQVVSCLQVEPKGCREQSLRLPRLQRRHERTFSYLLFLFLEAFQSGSGQTALTQHKKADTTTMWILRPDRKLYSAPRACPASSALVSRALLHVHPLATFSPTPERSHLSVRSLVLPLGSLDEPPAGHALREILFEGEQR